MVPQQYRLARECFFGGLRKILRKAVQIKVVENGKWKLENGNWKMENGKWKLENGKWKLENRNWKMEIGN